MKAQKAVFDCNLAKQEKNELLQKLALIERELSQAQDQASIAQRSLASKDFELRNIFEERVKNDSQIEQLRDQAQRAQRQADFEKKCREEDVERFQAEIKDLQDQIAEYEEETMTL